MQKRSCPVCQSQTLQTLLERQAVPVHQNLLITDRKAALSVPRGDLDIQFCLRCGFGHNTAFDSARIAYGEQYENAQGHSPVFQAHLMARIQAILSACQDRPRRIVEVGCGQGQFLAQLLSVSDVPHEGFGFDPSYRGPARLSEKRLHFYRQYYDARCAEIAADVIICRHVIEHVLDPVGLLETTRQALRQNPQARLYFETPDLDWILRHGVIWDFFYEHCSYFSPHALASCFQRAGFHVDLIESVFDGQYLWLEASLAPLETEKPPTALTLMQSLERSRRLADAYVAIEPRLLSAWTSQIQTLAAKGCLALWGAGAKGATLASLIDPDCRWIDCIVDMNARKQGHFIAGTGHAIVSPRQAKGRGVDTLLMMNANYLAENQAEAARLNWSPRWVAPDCVERDTLTQPS